MNDFTASVVLKGISLKSAPNWLFDLTFSVKYEWIIGSPGSKLCDGGWEFSEFDLTGILGVRKDSNSQTTLILNDKELYELEELERLGADKTKPVTVTESQLRLLAFNNALFQYKINLHQWMKEMRNCNEAIQSMISIKGMEIGRN